MDIILINSPFPALIACNASSPNTRKPLRKITGLSHSKKLSNESEGKETSLLATWDICSKN